ncbi:hypothetical protein ASD79_00915 [Caulobacter sp. Root655]|uniref:WcbI family polysaccharide biosynthesis putative acetyltransferase n=1 Tax=Caulobacter sp. Root655 TaxID=1736578 RepID=UPI000700E0F9|nr:WcbI family polysaccharide biosynthesis putative acetyltransferase [Caulobacter sp. Root655]KRA65876.1 hypothetical protein ASD79_00915 [Caulobacter sp. Root655]
MKPVLAVYGNCQAGVFCHALRRVPAINERYEVVYIQSFGDEDDRPDITPDQAARCEIYWRQVDEHARFNPDEQLAQARRITFPAVDLGLYWPFQTHDPLFGPEPEFPFGRYPYGDRVVVELSQRTPPPEDTTTAYHALANERLGNIDRSLDLELHRLQRREANADVKIAAFIFSSFRVERLYWAYNHPTSILLGKLFIRLAVATWPEAGDPNVEMGRVVADAFRGWEPFDHQHVPIPQVVAEKLGLIWWGPSLKYKYLDLYLSEQEYIEEYYKIRRERLENSSV